MLAIAGDHDSAQHRPAAERVQGVVEPLDQRTVIGVVDLGTVERDAGDATRIEAPEDRLVSHRHVSLQLK
jgi:hypothetical protein